MTQTPFTERNTFNSSWSVQAAKIRVVEYIHVIVADLALPAGPIYNLHSDYITIVIKNSDPTNAQKDPDLTMVFPLERKTITSTRIDPSPYNNRQDVNYLSETVKIVIRPDQHFSVKGGGDDKISVYYSGYEY